MGEVKQIMELEKKYLDQNVKKPLNAFFMYRKSIAEEIQKEHNVFKSHEISRIAGQCWATESPEVREKFAKMSRDAFIEHKLAFPEYIWPSKRCSRNKEKKKQSSLKECENSTNKSTRVPSIGEYRPKGSMHKSPVQNYRAFEYHSPLAESRDQHSAQKSGYQQNPISQSRNQEILTGQVAPPGYQKSPISQFYQPKNQDSSAGRIAPFVYQQSSISQFYEPRNHETLTGQVAPSGYQNSPSAQFYEPKNQDISADRVGYQQSPISEFYEPRYQETLTGQVAPSVGYQNSPSAQFYEPKNQDISASRVALPRYQPSPISEFYEPRNHETSVAPSGYQNSPAAQFYEPKNQDISADRVGYQQSPISEFYEPRYQETLTGQMSPTAQFFQQRPQESSKVEPAYLQSPTLQFLNQKSSMGHIIGNHAIVPSPFVHSIQSTHQVQQTFNGYILTPGIPFNTPNCYKPSNYAQNDQTPIFLFSTPDNINVDCPISTDIQEICDQFNDKMVNESRSVQNVLSQEPFTFISLSPDELECIDGKGFELEYQDFI